jgi:hypothetical protein
VGTGAVGVAEVDDGVGVPDAVDAVTAGEVGVPEEAGAFEPSAPALTAVPAAC